MLIRRLSFLLLIVTSLKAQASDSLLDIWDNNQAVQFLQQDKRIEAHEQFTQLLSDQPFHPLYQFNTGTSFIGIEDFENAIKMNEEILKNPSSPDQINFAALYNLGILTTTKGEVDKVLDYYQRALALKPDSVEIKTNIELLLQQKKGKGKGKGKNNKDKNNKKDENKDDSENEQEKEPQKFQNQPNQFKSKEMSKSDVKKILEELKKQEQRIRAKHDRKGGKEADRDKNW